MQITVKAKGDFGWSPVINAEIVKGQEFTIEEDQFSDDLYERPTGFIPPWERPDVAGTPVSKKKGGTE